MIHKDPFNRIWGEKIEKLGERKRKDFADIGIEASCTLFIAAYSIQPIAIFKSLLTVNRSRKCWRFFLYLFQCFFFWLSSSRKMPLGCYVALKETQLRRRISKFILFSNWIGLSASVSIVITSLRIRLAEWLHSILSDCFPSLPHHDTLLSQNCLYPLSLKHLSSLFLLQTLVDSSLRKTEENFETWIFRWTSSKGKVAAGGRARPFDNSPARHLLVNKTWRAF